MSKRAARPAKPPPSMPAGPPLILYDALGHVVVRDAVSTRFIACSRETLRGALHRFQPDVPLYKTAATLRSVDDLLLAHGLFVEPPELPVAAEMLVRP